MANTPSRFNVPSPARNVLSNWTGFILSALVNFFLSPFVVNHLGELGYGVWILTGSLTGYLGLLDLGVRGAVTRYVARFHTAGSHDDSSQMTSSALSLFVVTGLVAIVLGIVFAVTVIDHFTIPDGYRVAAKAVVMITAGSVAVSLTGGVFGGVVIGLERFDLANTIEIAMMLLRTIAILSALSSGGGIVSLALINLASTLTTTIVFAYVSASLYPQLQLGWLRWNRRYVRLIVSFSAYSFFLQLMGVVVFYSDAVVIAALLPISEVTYFTIAGNLIAYCRDLLSGISTIALPRASGLEAAGNLSELRRVLLTGNRMSTMIVLPIVATFMIRGQTFIGLWMGYQYAEASARVLLILSLYVAVAAGNQVASAALLGVGRHKGLAPLAGAEAVANIMLSVFLARSMGIVGVAFGTTVPKVVMSLWLLPNYIRREFGFGFREYMASSWLRPATAVLPFVLSTLLVEHGLQARNLAAFFAQVAGVVALNLPAFWYLGLTREERDHYTAALRPGIRSVLRVVGK